MIVGLVAGYRYLQTHSVSELEIFAICLGTFLFGIALPFMLIKKIENQLKEWERNTQKMISEWVASWVVAQRNSDDEYYKDPLFWLNFFLIGIEGMHGQFKNPYFHFVCELSPLIRQSLEAQKNLSKKKTKAQKAA
ncbi:MAG: hypothetical protein IPM57_06875 [Oligoflexia bacterium]|nr:hypothetical protein [Oligoflexia bacterium]